MTRRRKTSSNAPRKARPRSGQAILEYILMVIMLAVTMAVTIRNTNQNIYCLWTGLARWIAAPCPECTTPSAPGTDQCLGLDNLQ